MKHPTDGRRRGTARTRAKRQRRKKTRGSRSDRSEKWRSERQPGWEWGGLSENKIEKGIPPHPPSPVTFSRGHGFPGVTSFIRAASNKNRAYCTASPHFTPEFYHTALPMHKGIMTCKHVRTLGAIAAERHDLSLRSRVE